MSGWARDAVFYHIYPLGFCGAPEYNDFSAPVPRLDKLYDWIGHLKDLGVTALYLGPVFQSTKHGYDTADYFQIDGRLGDNEGFAKLCGALHEAGIKVVLDGVFNHVGRDFWAFQDVQKNGQGSPYCGWFHDLNFGGPSPLGDPFWYTAWQGHYELVKLNLRNPDVVAHLLEAVGMWMDTFHIDGLRLDAADCVDFDFFRALKAFVRGKDPDFWLMGEIIHGDYARWANPELLDSVTNYECWKGLWSAHNTKNYFEIAHSLHDGQAAFGERVHPPLRHARRPLPLLRRGVGGGGGALQNLRHGAPALPGTGGHGGAGPGAVRPPDQAGRHPLGLPRPATGGLRKRGHQE